MLRATSRHIRLDTQVLMLLLFASVLATGQSVTSQSPSLQSQSAQPVSGQPLSDQPSSNQASQQQPLSGSSSSAQSLPQQSLPQQSSSQQSLADAARANQQKKAEAATEPRKITNADIPKNPEGYTGPPADEVQNSAPSPENQAESRQAARQRSAEQRAAGQWRQRIMAQENVVANLQARVDQLRARINLFDPNAYYDNNRGEYNGGPTRLMERLHQMEDQLNQQKQRLEAMQDAARHAGMHTSSYDP